MRTGALLMLASAAGLVSAETFRASAGVMLAARGLDHLSKRDVDSSKPLAQRALATDEDAELTLNERGEISFPESPADLLERSLHSSSSHRGLVRRWNKDSCDDAPAKKSSKTKSKSKSSAKDVGKTIEKTVEKIVSSFKAKITWYTGGDLEAPSCLDWRVHWTPTDASHIAALTIDWPGKPKCGDFMRLSSKGKSTIVRVMDSCGGCQSGNKHVDLTRAAFQELYDFDVGEVDDIECEVLGNPPDDADDEDKYGPLKGITTDNQ